MWRIADVTLYTHIQEWSAWHTILHFRILAKYDDSVLAADLAPMLRTEDDCSGARTRHCFLENRLSNLFHHPRITHPGSRISCFQYIISCTPHTPHTHIILRTHMWKIADVTLYTHIQEWSAWRAILHFRIMAKYDDSVLAAILNTYEYIGASPRHWEMTETKPFLKTDFQIHFVTKGSLNPTHAYRVSSTSCVAHHTHRIHILSCVHICEG